MEQAASFEGHTQMHPVLDLTLLLLHTNRKVRRNVFSNIPEFSLTLESQPLIAAIQILGYSRFIKKIWIWHRIEQQKCPVIRFDAVLVHRSTMTYVDIYF